MVPIGSPLSGVATHVSPPMAGGDRGREFGTCHAAAVANTIAFYRRILEDDLGAGEADLRNWGDLIQQAIAEAGRDDVVDELEGLADGAGQPRHLIMALNARTELLSGSRYAAGTGRGAGGGLPAECSAVGLAGTVTRDGRCYLAQNWDFHPDLRPSRVLWASQDASGRWMCSLVEAGMLGKLGLNSSGLALTLNYLVSADDGGLGGMPVHVLARLVLECGDLSSALRQLLTAPVTASTCFNVALSDAGGDTMLSVELTPSGSRVVHPRLGGVLVHTNHFLEPAGVEDRVLGPQGWFGTLVRHAQLSRAFSGRDGLRPTDIFSALSSHHNAPESVCLHKEGDGWNWIDQGVTLASVAMDVGRGRIWFAGGNPCRHPHEPLDVAAWLAVHGSQITTSSA